ncbi:hypothetical protein L218DRAFT_131109 [Marasmius fiardii PR-910]|nr:hypothetical protein L218DRAFT_131109 [Marasmius fiardii PR-910]
MQCPTALTAPHHLLHPPPQLTPTSNANDAIVVELSPVVKQHKARGDASIMRRDIKETHYMPTGASTTAIWSSTTTDSFAARLAFQERHGDDVTTPVTPTPPALPPLKRRQCVPLPSQSDSSSAVVLHPSLVCPSKVGVHWDLMNPQGNLESDERWHPLKELASHPALPSMTVVHPWLPWPITVHASGINPRGVMVADVLLAISRNLMIPTDREGGTRMSYLRGKRMFVGLQVSGIGGDIWELVVE